MNKIFALLASLFFVGTAVAEQVTPFGFVMGTPITQVDPKAVKISDQYQYAVQPVKPFDGFDVFIVQATPKAGLCWLMVATIPVQVSSGRGEELVEAYFKFVEVSTKNFGKPSDVVLLETEDNPFKQPHQFMFSLLNQDRTIFTMWDAKQGAELPDNLTRVVVHLTAPDDSSSGRIAVEFAFKNEFACELEVLDQNSQLN